MSISCSPLIFMPSEMERFNSLAPWGLPALVTSWVPCGSIVDPAPCTWQG